LAVAEERLRIARDLHDLLGHSLSLITLKAELAGRLINVDPDRAAIQISELESVARRSLGEVRGAVTGYRQPDLRAELAAARQLLTAAGIACTIAVPDDLDLAPRADALLAWSVREAVTNVVRHSAASRATITVRSWPGGCSAEVTDDGAGAAAPAGAACPAAGTGGTGLAGLAERVSEFGGELTAGPVQPRGFRLLVTIPLPSSPDIQAATPPG
jgi:two-component system sensor histidine kinase DesK